MAQSTIWKEKYGKSFRSKLNGRWTEYIGAVNQYQQQSNNIRMDGKKQIQNTDFIGQRNGLHKDQPKNVVGTDIGVNTPDIQPKP